MDKLYPEKWNTIWKQLEKTELDKDEQIEVIVQYQIEQIKTNKKVHNIFTVTSKENKIYGKLTLYSENTPDKNSTVELVEYPIENKEELKKEFTELAIDLGQKTIETGEIFGLRINTNKEFMVYYKKGNKTNQEIMNDLNSLTDPEKIKDKEILIKALGIKEDKSENINILKLPIFQNNQTKEEEEKELIKKFGRKNINKLAKKMNYHGLIINKIKTTNVTKN